MTGRNVRLLFAAVLVAGLASTPISSQELGTIAFPTSGSAAHRRRFSKG